MSEEIADAILDTLRSPNVSDSNGEVANVVDTINNLAKAAWGLRDALSKPGVPYKASDGGVVGDVCEALIFIGESQHRQALAIESLAESVQQVALAIANK